MWAGKPVLNLDNYPYFGKAPLTAIQKTLTSEEREGKCVATGLPQSVGSSEAEVAAG